MGLVSRGLHVGLVSLDCTCKKLSAMHLNLHSGMFSNKTISWGGLLYNTRGLVSFPRSERQTNPLAQCYVTSYMTLCYVACSMLLACHQCWGSGFTNIMCMAQAESDWPATRHCSQHSGISPKCHRLPYTRHCIYPCSMLMACHLCTQVAWAVRLQCDGMAAVDADQSNNPGMKAGPRA